MRNQLAFALYLYIIIWVLELIRIFLFQSNIENLVTKLKLKLGSFIGRKKKILFLAPGKEMLDFSNAFNMIGLIALYECTDQCLEKLDTVYQRTFDFITSCGNLAHHCSLYAAAPSLCTHWAVFI